MTVRNLIWNHKATEDQSDMMTTKELDDSMGRDTTMCGDPKMCWCRLSIT